MNLAFILFIIAAIWWVLWMILAINRKSYTIFTFLLVVGSVWGIFEYLTAVNENPLAYALLIIPVILLFSVVRIIMEYQRGVLFRLGRMRQILEPGINLIFPLGIDFVRKIDLRTFTIDVPKQEIITKDNVPVLVDAVVYFSIFDPNLAVVKVADYTKSTSLLGQTILRSVLGQHELDDMLSKRSELNTILQKLLDNATDPWGVKISAVEIKAIELPDSMKRAMAKQAEAERERRSKVIAADGEYQASEKLSAAAKVIATQPISLQLRYLQTLSEIAIEKNSTILFPLPMEILKFFEHMAESKK